MKKIKEYCQLQYYMRMKIEDLDKMSREDGWNLVSFNYISQEEKPYHYIFARDVEVEKKEKPIKVIEENADFIDRIYAMYPSRCPVRNTSLGKCKKDKERIKKLLNDYTEEQIEYIVKKEIEEKFNKSYMQNFSTFLNNFPDPACVEPTNLFPEEKNETIELNGVKYR